MQESIRASKEAQQQQRREKEARAIRWREVVMAKAADLQGQLNVADTEGRKGIESQVQEHLDAAVEAAGVKGKLIGHLWIRGRDWITGARVDRAWAHLHNADLLLATVARDADLWAGRGGVLALVKEVFQPGDPRRTMAEASLGVPKPPFTSKDKAAFGAAYRAALRWAFDASDELYARVRSLRNIIIGWAVVLLLLACLVATVGITAAHIFDLCFTNTTPVNPSELGREPSGVAVVEYMPSCPTGNSPNRLDVAVVEGLGLFGGALSAIVAVRNMTGTSTPYGIPAALVMLKLPAGALVALAGLLLIQGRFLPGLSALDSPAQILAWAVLLGFAQHLVTRLIDRQAEDVLGKVPSPEADSTPKGGQWPQPKGQA